MAEKAKPGEGGRPDIFGPPPLVGWLCLIGHLFEQIVQ